MTLNVACPDGIIQIIVIPTTPFAKLIHAYCERSGSRACCVRLVYKVYTVNALDVPSDHGMQDGDTI